MWTWRSSKPCGGKDSYNLKVDDHHASRNSRSKVYVEYLDSSFKVSQCRLNNSQPVPLQQHDVHNGGPGHHCIGTSFHGSAPQSFFCILTLWWFMLPFPCLKDNDINILCSLFRWNQLTRSSLRKAEHLNNAMKQFTLGTWCWSKRRECWKKSERNIALCPKSGIE